MTLQRKKDDLTGTLEVTIFGGSMPNAPIAREAKAGADILVYIAGQLAFTGNVDAREGTGKKGHKNDKVQHTGKAAPSAKSSGNSTSGTTSVNIGPNEYSVKLSARGKTKRLINSSHQHPTTNMMQPTTKEVIEKLIEPWQVKLDWKGEVIKLDKQRFRDGATVVDELHRVALENCYFMYETRDGQLRVTDGVGTESGSGDALILGENILTFSAEQSEDKAKSKVKVKGQRSKKDIRGKKALEKTHKTVTNSKVKSKNLLTIQHYGDATDKELERRARFEMNKRNSASQKITIEVFHVQTPSGQPWDIGNTHYVEVPPEGIFDVFECTELTYHVNHEKELKTTLVLSPPPSGGAGEGGGGGGGGGAGGFGLAALNMAMGAARRSQADIPIVSGMYPDAWGPPMLSNDPFMSLVEAAALPLTDAEKAEREKAKETPPLTLPPWLGETS